METLFKIEYQNNCKVYQRSTCHIPVTEWLRLTKENNMFRPGVIAQLYLFQGQSSASAATITESSSEGEHLRALVALYPRSNYHAKSFLLYPYAAWSDKGKQCLGPWTWARIGPIYYGSRTTIADTVVIEEIRGWEGGKALFQDDPLTDDTKELATKLTGYIVADGVELYTSDDGLLSDGPVHDPFNGVVEKRKRRYYIKSVPSDLPSTPRMLSFGTNIEIVSSDFSPTIWEKEYLGEVDWPPRKAIESSIKELQSRSSYAVDSTSPTTMSPSTRILITGPPAVGKSYLVRGLARYLNIPLVTIHGAECYSMGGITETKDSLHARFAAAQRKAKVGVKAAGIAILLLDELELLAPKIEDDSSLEHRRLISATKSIIRDPRWTNLLMIACTSRREEVDESILELFPRSVMMEPPSMQGRFAILSKMLNSLPDATSHCAYTAVPTSVKYAAQMDPANTLPEKYIEELAKKSIGFTPGDLLLLSKNVLLKLKQSPLLIAKNEDAHINVLLEKAFKETPVSLKKDYKVNIDSSITWEDVGGMDSIKERLYDIIEGPLKEPTIYKHYGIRPPRGVLLHGPPGCSKTTIAKILANSGGFSFYSLSGAQIYSAYLGESERQVRETFANARLTRPSLIFFDEIDAIVGKRAFGAGGGVDPVQERILATFLTEMDGVQGLEGVLVLGATNRLYAIDEALLRPGRFDYLIEIPLPDGPARLSILLTLTRGTRLDDDVELEELVGPTEGWSGAQLKQLIQEASILAIRRQKDTLNKAEIMDALLRPAHHNI